MTTILQNNTTMVLIIAILIIGIIFLINLLTAFTKICESIDRLYVGAIDMVAGMILMTLWNEAFRDTEYLNPVLFWAVLIGFLFVIITGGVQAWISVSTCDARKR